MGKSDFEMNKGRNYARMREKESEGESERDRDRWIYEQIDMQRWRDRERQ